MSCASYLELGDAAFQRGNWEVAFIHYQRALSQSTNPAELEHLKARLDASRAQAGAQYLASAQDLVGIGDHARALAHAERAFQFTPTPAVKDLLRDLRAREGARLLDLGKAAVQAQQWDVAARRLERAQQLAPTPEGGTLLAQARAECEKLHQAEFTRLWDEAREQLHARNWVTAAHLYRAAHQHAKTRQSLVEQQFVQRMAEAEALCARTPFDTLTARKVVRNYREALALGVDTDYVHARLLAIEPGTYIITLNSAVILPFQPGSKRPWDGGAARQVRGADDLLRELATFAAPQVEIADLGGPTFRRISAHHDAPDCYPLMKIGRRVEGGPHCARDNDLRPSWNLQMRVDDANAFDKRVLHVRVLDKDARDSDHVGSFHVPLADLILHPGVQVIRFFDSTGRLQADGLLAVTITVNRL